MSASVQSFPYPTFPWLSPHDLASSTMPRVRLFVCHIIKMIHTFLSSLQSEGLMWMILAHQSEECSDMRRVGMGDLKLQPKVVHPQLIDTVGPRVLKYQSVQKITSQPHFHSILPTAQSFGFFNFRISHFSLDIFCSFLITFSLCLV